MEDERRRQLLACIDRAFTELTLGDGVSLHESDVIDEHETAEKHRAVRGWTWIGTTSKR